LRDALISVHIRWSDKMVEANLAPVSDYLEQVLQIAERHRMKAPVVFLSSEDGAAITLFEQAVAEEPRAKHVSVIKFEYPRISLACGGINVTERLGSHGPGLLAANLSQYVGQSWTGVKRMERERAMFNAAKEAGTECLNLDQTKDILRQSHNQSLTMVSLLNMYLALECRHIICLTRSNWCWLLGNLADSATNLIGEARVGLSGSG